MRYIKNNVGLRSAGFERSDELLSISDITRNNLRGNRVPEMDYHSCCFVV